MKDVKMKWWLMVIFLQCNMLGAQHRWDGDANNRLWSDPLNWEGDSLPNPGSNVLLDNIFIDSSYSIMLDPAAGSVIIASLEIFPAGGKNIRLIIPSQNQFAPALNCQSDHSIVLKEGAILQNSSGASSGSIILLGDSVYLQNGSRYIHNTSRAHASFVSLLSSGIGTEEGIFEFDVPSASTTVSLSDRTFGRLVFSSSSAGGSSSYTASGTRPIRVRSGLDLINGAKLNLNFSDTLHVGKDLNMLGSTINLSSSLRNLVLKINGNIITDENSFLTESGSAHGQILLAGKQLQELNVKGILLNDIRIKFDNPSGIVLRSKLYLPSRVELKSGVVHADSSARLQLGQKGYFVLDTLFLGSFVNGPVYMESDSIRLHTLIPVGDKGLLRWIALKNWSGNMVVEYLGEDPNQFGVVETLDHISKQGYWKFSNWMGTAESMELSFPDANFSGVTDLASLGGASFSGSTWSALNIIERKGSPGSNGSLIAGPIAWQQTNFFALGSYLPSQNPLPIAGQIRKKKSKEPFNMQILKAYKSGDEVKVVIESPQRGSFELAMANSLGQILVKRNINVMKGRQIITLRLPLQSPSIFHLFGLFWGVPVKPLTVFL